LLNSQLHVGFRITFRRLSLLLNLRPPSTQSFSYLASGRFSSSTASALLVLSILSLSSLFPFHVWIFLVGGRVPVQRGPPPGSNQLFFPSFLSFPFIRPFPPLLASSALLSNCTIPGLRDAGFLDPPFHSFLLVVLVGHPSSLFFCLFIIYLAFTDRVTS